MDIADWKRVATSVKHYQIVTFDIFLAGEAGFEPTLTVLETAVLPLYYSPKKVGDHQVTHLDLFLSISREAWLPDQHLLFYHPRGLRTGDPR